MTEGCWGALCLAFALVCASSSAHAADLVQPAGEVAPMPVAPQGAAAPHHTPDPPPNAPTLAPVHPRLVEHGLRQLPKVALTFDACSSRSVSHYDEKVTEVLERTHTPATLFVGGTWALEEAAQLKALAANPLFEIANHTWTHPHMPKVSAERVREELLRAQGAVYAVTGRQPTLFRPPFGEYDEKVVQIAAELGLTTIEYDLASGDPDEHATKQKLIDWVLLKARPGSIIVMHINKRGWHTAEALPGIIDGLRKKGYELVTVGELLRDEEVERLAAAVRGAVHRQRTLAQGPCAQYGVRGGLAGIDW